MKTLQLSIISIAGITAIGTASFAIILPQQSATQIEGVDNDIGITTIENQAYHYSTVGDTLTTYQGSGVKVQFHNVTFTFFPHGFSPGPVGSCGGFSFESSVKFSDGKHELLGVFVPGMPCLQNYTQTDLSNHTNPQAGLTVYDGKIRLLVDTSQDQMVTLVGDDAWRVCGALGIPCSSNPIFHARHAGNDTLIVVVEGNGIPYTVTLNDTTTCVSPTLYGRPSCQAN